MKYVIIMWDSGSEVEKCIDGSLSSVTSKDLNALSGRSTAHPG